MIKQYSDQINSVFKIVYLQFNDTQKKNLLNWNNFFIEHVYQMIMFCDTIIFDYIYKLTKSIFSKLYIFDKDMVRKNFKFSCLKHLSHSAAKPNVVPVKILTQSVIIHTLFEKLYKDSYLIVVMFIHYFFSHIEFSFYTNRSTS